MKNLLPTVIICTIFLFAMPTNSETIRGGTTYDVIPKGFFGTWRVISKMETSNNPSIFNKLSVDIWNLSGAGSVLVLENAVTGAKSSIQVQPAGNSFDGKTLKFQRVKEEISGKYKYIQRESPEFVLNGNVFKGYDTYIVEKYENNKLISKDVVKYVVIGQKISGESRINEW